jgi:predicted RNA-binding Zn-ribbon protein involved in translation (DUF1610 family)
MWDGTDGRILPADSHSSSVARTRKPPDWLIQERRETLGPWAAFCRRCGHALRYFDDDQVPAACPQCGGEVRSRCPACDAPFASAFAVDCETCGAPLRDAELFDTKIRRD